MEERAGDSKVCSNCKKKVAVANFALHEPHCLRFLGLCPDCDEPVPHDQLEEHRQTEHSQVRCPQCKKKVENCKLEEHKSEQCENRVLGCEFCQLELPFRKLQEHREQCGSKTQQCPDCGRYIKLRDVDAHALTCTPTAPTESEVLEDTAAPIPRAPTQKPSSELCWYCMKSFPPEQLKAHQVDCYTESPPKDEPRYQQDPRPHFGVPRSSRSTPYPLWGCKGPGWEETEGADLDEIRTCSNCHLALPVATLRWHEAKCLQYKGLRKGLAQ
ncbi:XIAP-associated factor 1 [Amia ocellicauda]|uniref:XIAP-associated factor 1 n=1 Tax=Amia ocellicauda TaxID=2972642 RepID=UPI00346393CB